jgi:hypothetical protein
MADTNQFIPGIPMKEYERAQTKFLKYSERVGLSERGFKSLKATDKSSFFCAFLEGIACLGNKAL